MNQYGLKSLSQWGMFFIIMGLVRFSMSSWVIVGRLHFLRICPFDLNFQIYWHKFLQNIFLYMSVGVVVTSFVILVISVSFLPWSVANCVFLFYFVNMSSRLLLHPFLFLAYLHGSQRTYSFWVHSFKNPLRLVFMAQHMVMFWMFCLLENRKYSAVAEYSILCIPFRSGLLIMFKLFNDTDFFFKQLQREAG